MKDKQMSEDFVLSKSVEKRLAVTNPEKLAKIKASEDLEVPAPPQKQSGHDDLDEYLEDMRTIAEIRNKPSPAPATEDLDGLVASARNLANNVSYSDLHPDDAEIILRLAAALDGMRRKAPPGGGYAESGPEVARINVQRNDPADNPLQPSPAPASEDIAGLMADWHKARVVDRPDISREAPMIAAGDCLAAALDGMRRKRDKLCAALEEAYVREEHDVKALAAAEKQNAELRSAAQALIDDVRRRYPGEELRCPLMRRLDDLLTKGRGE